MLTRTLIALAAVAPLAGFAFASAPSAPETSPATRAIGPVMPAAPQPVLRLRAESVEVTNVPGGRMCRVEARVVEVQGETGPRAVNRDETVRFQTLCHWSGRARLPSIAINTLRSGETFEVGFAVTGRDQRLSMRPLSFRRVDA